MLSLVSSLGPRPTVRLPRAWFSTLQTRPNPHPETKSRKEEKQLYYLQNKENLLAKVKQYRLKNKAALAAQQTQYRAENRELLNAKAKKHHTENKESINAKRKQFRLNNKEAVNAQQREFYARNKEAISKRRVAVPSSLKSWKSVDQVRSNLEELGRLLKIRDPTEWYRVSRTQVTEKGYASLLTHFKGLGPALLYAYPEVHWDTELFSTRNKKSVQRWLKYIVMELLPPGTTIEEECSHPQLSNPYRGYILDIFVPEYNLAFEYQGVQHYSPQKGCFGPLDDIQKNDLLKKQLCEKASITLIAVPYWWDKKTESLAATLHALIPHLIDAKPHWKPIPNDPPKPHPVEIWGHKKLEGTKILMHGRNWNPQKTDPTGWIITEKFDGVRGYWDGSAFYSKNGYLLNTPLEISQMLPSDVPLDGEFWLGYNKFYELISLINRAQLQTEMNEEDKQKLWEPVMYKIFDAPGHPGCYTERISWAKSSLASSNSKISVASYQVCTSTDHLTQELSKVKAAGGEGLMIYHPKENYTPGRTNRVQKVKVPLDLSHVTFQRVNTKSAGLICEQSDGTACLIKCSPYDFQNPPPQGTTISVQHAGYHKKSNKMKAPVLVRIN